MGRELSYAQLDARSNQLAHLPARPSASAPRWRVGLCVERSPMMVIG